MVEAVAEETAGAEAATVEAVVGAMEEVSTDVTGTSSCDGPSDCIKLTLTGTRGE